jgi:hydroxymethylpyrimidine/phosphomethylpyrimidine kinase
MTTDTPVALTIAGSDSGGGAGIQADLKTFHAFGVFGTSALTAVTAQNTVGVREVLALPVGMVCAQIDAVVEDLIPRAVKSGMLATEEIAAAVADRIAAHRLGPYVLDHVLVATSGDRLATEGVTRVILGSLLPLATLVTPNLEEAGALTDALVDDLPAMRRAARILVERGARAALIKGGHLEGSEAIDLLWDGSEERVWRRPRLSTPHTHGTGCTLSAAIAAGLARGLGLAEATERGVDFVARAIALAPGIGAGHGPLNHQVPALLPDDKEHP